MTEGKEEGFLAIQSFREGSHVCRHPHQCREPARLSWRRDAVRVACFVLRCLSWMLHTFSYAPCSSPTPTFHTGLSEERPIPFVKMSAF